MNHNAPIHIPVSAIQTARKLLTRILFGDAKLPVHSHVLATVDAAWLTLAVTDLDHWLETRIPVTVTPDAPRRFLIPAAAIVAASRGDKGSSVTFDTTGTAEFPALRLTVTCGGMSVESVYQPVAASDFPTRPALYGRTTILPMETMLALRTVAPCASTDASWHILNGVLFSPDDGGTLIATNRRLLAAAPARFAGRQFILPNLAVHVLGFPDFIARDAAILQPEGADKGAQALRVQFCSGPHTLITTTIAGNYPNYRKVIPREFLADATIPESHRSAVTSWLKSLVGRSPAVRLTWKTPGHLTLTHWDSGTAQANIQVPVSVSGEPQAISFNPRYLAKALAIGTTLRLTDGISPGMITDASGNYCVIMPCRCIDEIADEPAEEDAENNAHYVAPSENNTWTHTGGTEDSQP
ncbi:MAG: DNA polymerase III subunit beta [Verrucomicrobiota bacterium]